MFDIGWSRTHVKTGMIMFDAIIHRLLVPAKIHIFVGSSSILMPERRIVENVIKQLKTEVYDNLDVQLIPIFWENESRDASVAPEDAIALGLRRPRDCEVCVFMFSNWFGSSGTVEGENYESGTIWEYEDALKRPDRQMRIFRKNMSGTSLAIKNPNDIEAAEQWIKMVRYIKDHFHAPNGDMLAFYETFTEKDVTPESAESPTPFEVMIRRDVGGAIDRAVRQQTGWLATQVYQSLIQRTHASEKHLQEQFKLSDDQIREIGALLRAKEKITIFAGTWSCRTSS